MLEIYHIISSLSSTKILDKNLKLFLNIYRVKAALKVFLVFIFAVCSALLILSLSFNKADYSSKSLKTRLLSTGFYEKLDESIKSSLQTNSSGYTDEDPLSPLLMQLVTKDYIQQKTENLLDNIQLWTEGKATNPPNLTFPEIKEKILAQNPELLETLAETKNELAKAQKEAEKDQTEETNLDSQAVDFEKIINNDFSIPVGQNITWIKPLAFIAKNALIFQFILLASLLGIIFLTKGNKSKLRWAATTFAVTAVGNGLAFLIVTPISDLIVQNFEKSTIMPSFGPPVIVVFVTPFLNSYAYYTKMALIISVLIFAGTFTSSFFIKER